MKNLTPDQEIIKMHKEGYSLYQISTKVGLGTGYVVRQIREYRRLNRKGIRKVIPAESHFESQPDTWGFIYIR